MKFYSNLFLFLLPIITLAQVGVNTDDPKAMLDIVSTRPSSPSTNTGILIPRLNNFPSTNPGAEQHSMIVYLDANITRNISGSNTSYIKGFYYWDNDADDWIPFSSSSSSSGGWEIDGNDGLSSNSNFIGTTDNVELTFKVNNQETFRISSKGQLEVLSNVDNILIGKNAGERLSGGRENVIIGQDSDVNGTGFKETVILGNGLRAYGDNATVVGSGGSRATTDGVSIGRAAKSTATEAISIGYLSEATRNGAISIGKGAITKTSESISIGVNARVESRFDRSIALGVNANVTKDNQLMLSNDIKEISAEQATMRARSYVATASNRTYADYVFDLYYDGKSDLNKTYQFPTLEEAESFVKANGHLIGVKSIEDVQNQGMTIDVTETSLKNLEKLEEQFLYITELNSKIKVQNKRIEALEAQLNKVNELEKRILAMEAK